MVKHMCDTITSIGKAERSSWYVMSFAIKNSTYWWNVNIVRSEDAFFFKHLWMLCHAPDTAKDVRYECISLLNTRLHIKTKAE